MTSSIPYLIRAVYQWIVDNGMTPHLVVDLANEMVKAPRQFGDDGKIVLNIGHTAVHELNLGNTTISFSARFNGQAMDLVMPVESILAIYARENGQGMMFGDEEAKPPQPPGTRSANPAKPRLKVIK